MVYGLELKMFGSGDLGSGGLRVSEIWFLGQGFSFKSLAIEAWVLWFRG